MLIGQGVGQTRRDRAARLAVMIAAENDHSTAGAAACSDSFFPFVDGVEPLIKAGVTHIFSTSGAKRDHEVRKACVDGGVTLYQMPDAQARMFFGH
jgi:phosphoribosylaminoimidazolecarboxamide formyltransferase/IMP cyclohydrolase